MSRSEVRRAHRSDVSTSTATLERWLALVAEREYIFQTNLPESPPLSLTMRLPQLHVAQPQPQPSALFSMHVGCFAPGACKLLLACYGYVCCGKLTLLANAEVNTCVCVCGVEGL